MSDVVTLTLRAPLDAAVEFDGISGDRLAVLSAAEIEALPAWAGARQARLGDFFSVSGERSATVRIEGASPRVRGLGAQMSSGSLQIVGDAGDGVGAGMSGGTIEISGNAGDDAGVGMSGGLLRIAGNAGDRLGAGSAGAAKGMSGGEILVGGSAGRDAGARLRRGLIVITGDTGPSAGRAMIAGTLVVFGRVGAAPALGNKRGSIIAIGGIDVPATYRLACTFRPPSVRLTLTHLRRQHGLVIPDEVLGGSYQRFCGDAAPPGKGEILLWVR